MRGGAKCRGSRGRGGRQGHSPVGALTMRFLRHFSRIFLQGARVGRGRGAG